jgi:hypothetical protein
MTPQKSATWRGSSDWSRARSRSVLRLGAGVAAGLAAVSHAAAAAAPVVAQRAEQADCPARRTGAPGERGERQQRKRYRANAPKEARSRARRRSAHPHLAVGAPLSNCLATATLSTLVCPAACLRRSSSNPLYEVRAAQDHKIGARHDPGVTNPVVRTRRTRMVTALVRDERRVRA